VTGPRLARAVDAALEISVVGSFSRLGIAARARLEHWPEPGDLSGRFVIVTGTSSGIGRATALELARLGAWVWLIGRDRARTEDAARQARDLGAADVEPIVLDVVDAEAVQAFAERVGAAHDRLDGLVHAAGALSPSYRSAPDGSEVTVATAVLAPFRLTWLLSPLLRRSADADIVTVSSGGMYTERFDLERLELDPDHYRGTTAYARAKRAQVVLSHEWARRWGADGVASYASHPGWVDTPGLASGLPSFTRLGPLLRTPEQGADTVVWLAGGGPRRVGAGSGPRLEGFFHDRRQRREHLLPWTATSDPVADGARLWAWCVTRTGCGGDGRAELGRGRDGALR